MRLDELRRCQRHPLVERQVGVVVAPEHFQKAQVRGTSVLDVMSHGEGHVPDIAREIVERARLA